MPTQLIIEADGGSRGNPGPAAYGALVRSAGTGEVLAEVAEPIGVTTNNVAEYRGLIAGLLAARGIDPAARVEVRLDSRLIVEQMSGRWKIKNADLQALSREAKRVFPADQVTYAWVPRAENVYADRLVNQALDGEPLPRLEETEPTALVNRLVAWSTDLGTPTRLLVVRHGRTAMTTARQFSGGGVSGPPLDEVGRVQAANTAGLVAGAEAVAVIASPMLRAQQTAEVVAARLGVAVHVDDQWRECDFGVWDGLTLTEAALQYPDELTAWHESTAVAPPSGESLDQMTLRVSRARDRLAAQYPGQNVVVVTHSMPVRALVRLVLDAPPSAMFRLLPAPGSLTEIELYADGTTAVSGFGRRVE
ncbi:MAG: bifunctional RNase H/acid phosphatase [Jiangellaceae bacterium]